MKKLKYIVAILIFCLPVSALAAPTPIMSQKLIQVLATSTAKSTTNPLSIDLFVCLLIMAAKFLFGLVGVFSLIMFVYGGFTFLTSGGSSKRVSEGKAILTNAIIGLILVFASYMIVKFVIGAIGGDPNIIDTSVNCPL